MAGLLIYGGVVGYKYSLKRTIQYNESLLNSVLMNQEHLFKMDTKILSEWADDIIASNLRPEEACSSSVARPLMPNDSMYTVFSVTNTKGQVVCANGAAIPPVDVSDRKYIQQAIETKKLTTGEYQIGRVSKKKSINIGYPVVKNDEVQMVLVLGVSLDWLGRYFKDFEYLKGMEILIVDREGTILGGDATQDSRVGTKVSDINIFSLVLARGKGSFIANGADGKKTIYSYAPLAVSEPNAVPQSFIFLGTDKNAVLVDVLKIVLTIALSMVILFVVEYHLATRLFSSTDKKSKR